MSDELVVKISGDIKDLSKAFEDATKETEALNDKLGSIAKASGVVFAALTAQVAVSLKQFSEAKLASNQLAAALQNQGIYTDDLKDSYEEYANQVAELTGIENDEIIKSQAVAQSFLGQMPITKDLTQAIADLAAEQGVSLTSAAEEMGKAIGNGTGMLLRQGLQFSATDSEAQRYEKTLAFVQQRAGGFAVANADASLGVKNLEQALKENAEALGSKFAPAFRAVVDTITDFVRPAKDAGEEMLNLKAAFIAVGIVLSALGIALPIVVNGFLALRAAMIAIGIGAGPLGLIVVAIGLLVFGIVELVAHWQTASARIKDIVQGLVTFVAGSFKGLGSVLSGAFHLDMGKIKEGLAEIQEAFKSGVKEATAELPKETEKALVKQDEVKKKFADKFAAQRKQEEADKLALQEAENELIRLKIEEASAELIKDKEEEVKTLKELTVNKNLEQRELLREQIEDEREQTEIQHQDDLAKEETFGELDMQVRRNLAERSREFSDDVNKKDLAKIQSTIKTREIVEREAYTTELKDMIAAHNKFLEEQNKYGTMYASLNMAMHSNEVQGFKQATGDLVQLTNSKNSTLKQIGKVATVANITIKTAESAMNIFAGFSAIPIVGPALGLAGAAAAIAYGAEQVQNVLSAQTGGMVPGTGFGDHIPAILEPGETITPRQNYNEMVNAVADSRVRDQGGVTEEVGHAIVQLQLSGDLGKIVEAKIIERQKIGISLIKTPLSAT